MLIIWRIKTILFQNYALIDDESIKDNLMLALEYVKMNKTEKKDLIKKTLKKVGIEKDINEKIYSLSGGEQQRVSLARTLLKPSKLILADEPTGNLDESNRNDIIKILLEMQKKGKTIIIVTHDNVVAYILTNKLFPFLSIKIANIYTTNNNISFIIII